jgi:hypothetical protein
MAKQNPSSPVDEQYLMSVIAGGFSTKKEPFEPVTRQPKEPEQKQEEDEAAVTQEKPNVGEKPREPAKRKRGNATDYETVFLQRGELKARKAYTTARKYTKGIENCKRTRRQRAERGGLHRQGAVATLENYMNEINELYEKKYTKLF